MSFEAAWGFDPRKAMESEGLPVSEMDKFAYSAAEQRAARIPPDVQSQIYELRRMYRL